MVVTAATRPTAATSSADCRCSRFALRDSEDERHLSRDVIASALGACSWSVDLLHCAADFEFGVAIVAKVFVKWHGQISSPRLQVAGRTSQFVVEHRLADLINRAGDINTAWARLDAVENAAASKDSAAVRQNRKPFLGALIA